MVKIKLNIDGMMCGMCEAHINDAVRRNFQVKKVTSSHTKGRTEIISENEIDEEKLREVLTETGYTVLSFSKEQYKRKGLFFGLRKGQRS